MLYTAIATGAILGWAFNVDTKYKAYIFLIPIIILISAVAIISVVNFNTYKIAAYITVFIEEEIEDMRYENVLAKYRKEKGRSESFDHDHTEQPTPTNYQSYLIKL
mgnify:CR=1 FL=1